MESTVALLTCLLHCAQALHHMLFLTQWIVSRFTLAVYLQLTFPDTDGILDSENNFWVPTASDLIIILIIFHFNS